MPHRSARMVAFRRSIIGCCAAGAVVTAGWAFAANDAWRYSGSPLPGGGGTVPQVYYSGPRDRGFGLMAACHGSGPSIYITVNDPGPDLRQLRFDTPISVLVRLQRQPPGKATPADEARVTATLSEGYTPYTRRIHLGIGLQDGAAVASLLGRVSGSEPTRAIVEIGKTSASFVMSGAHEAFAHFRRSCDAQR